MEAIVTVSMLVAFVGVVALYLVLAVRLTEKSLDVRVRVSLLGFFTGFPWLMVLSSVILALGTAFGMNLALKFDDNKGALIRLLVFLVGFTSLRLFGVDYQDLCRALEDKDLERLRAAHKYLIIG